MGPANFARLFCKARRAGAEGGDALSSGFVCAVFTHSFSCLVRGRSGSFGRNKDASGSPAGCRGIEKSLGVNPVSGS